MPAAPHAFIALRASHLAGGKARGVKDVVRAGEVVTGGRIVACDPLVQPDRRAFVRTIAPGRHAVHLFVARAGSEVGFAELRVRDTAIVRFEVATIAGQDAATLGEHEAFAYPVDSGIGCFADATALRRLQGRGDGFYDDVVHPALALNGGRWAVVEQVVMFRTGGGDGTFATYFGIDADGEVTCVVTSFGVFAEPETPEKKLRRVAEWFAPMVAAIDRDIGARLKARGFVGPEATYKAKADDGSLRLAYARDGLVFEVDSETFGPHMGSTAFRWLRGRAMRGVGEEHEAAGVKLALPRGLAIAVGDAAFDMAAKIGATYAKQWEALERALLAMLPVRPTKAKPATTAKAKTATTAKAKAAKAAKAKAAKTAKPKPTKAAKPKSATTAKPKLAKTAKPKSATTAKSKTPKAAKPKTAKTAKPKPAKSAKPKSAKAAKPKPAKATKPKPARAAKPKKPAKPTR